MEGRSVEMHQDERRMAGTTDLVVARPDQRIVAQIAADIGRHDFSRDAVAGQEVAVASSRHLIDVR